MLVLTRKTDEQILIGNDIKITLVRVRGNSVRIGIDAPRDVRVVRGELERFDSDSGAEDQFELSEREHAFAHPPTSVAGAKTQSEDRELPTGVSSERIKRRGGIEPSGDQQVFVGRIRRVDDGLKPNRAPLARFISAT